MINEEYLKELTGGDTNLHQQLLQQFIHTTENDIKCLEKAVIQRKLSAVKHYSHRIRGSAQLLSISPLIDMASVLENSSEALLNTTLQARYQQLSEIFTQVKLQIQPIP